MSYRLESRCIDLSRRGCERYRTVMMGYGSIFPLLCERVKSRYRWCRSYSPRRTDGVILQRPESFRDSRAKSLTDTDEDSLCRDARAYGPCPEVIARVIDTV